MDFCKKKKKLRKTIRATGLKSESIMPIIILHNRLDLWLWYGIINTFFNFFFTINFYPFLHFWPSLPCTSQWGKFLSSKFCISDFRIEIYTKFQSGKHIIFYILANFFFNFFFSHQMSAKPWSDLEPCHMYVKMGTSIFNNNIYHVYVQYNLHASHRVDWGCTALCVRSSTHGSIFMALRESKVAWVMMADHFLLK